MIRPPPRVNAPPSMNAPTHFQDLPTGQFLLERYRIERTLGRGGFGITYQATDVVLERLVVIKELLPQQIAMRDQGRTVVPLDDDHRESFEWARGRFLDEARMLARFDHPNIVRVIDFFAENATAYFAMPYLEGTSLSAVIKERGLFGLEDVRALIFPILDGLRQVHASGILHRDIKPDNIWVTRQGAPVLLDFGAARQAIGLQSHEVTTISTASYAPIEQLGGEEGKFGPYTDIYALGVVVYKAATGSMPPPARQRVREDLYQPLATRGARLPAHVAAAVDWALALYETERPQTVDDWLGALEGGPGHPTAEPPLPPPPGPDPLERSAVRSHATARPTVPPRPGPDLDPPTDRLRPVMPGTRGKSSTTAWVTAGMVAALLAAGCIFLLGAFSKDKPGPENTPAPRKATVGGEPSLVGRQAGEVRDLQVIKNVFVRCCWCPPGSFHMGNSPEELRQLAEMGTTPEESAAVQHPVTLPDGFWMAKYETTAAEVKGIEQALRREIFAPLHPSDPPASQPAAALSWNRCAELCSALDSENPFPGWQIRLPTEQEWEYACRAGTVTAYSFGPSLNGSEANCDGNRPFPKTGSFTAGGPRLARVARGGSYPPNPWGICDLHGNLAEWCQDPFARFYPVNGVDVPAADISTTDHVLRGGSWDSAARNCRSAARLSERTDYESDTIGFRLVLARRSQPAVQNP